MASEGSEGVVIVKEGDGVGVVGRVRRRRRRVTFSEENIIDEVDEDEEKEEEIITDILEENELEFCKGGYDYEFVDQTDQKYECPICLHCLRDPVLTTCGHRFCSGCILQWVTKEDGKCPVDSVSISPENIFPDNYTRREILACLAKCPYISPKDNSRCPIVLPVSDLEKHIENEHTSHYDYIMGLNGIIEGGGPSTSSPSIPSPGTSTTLPNGLIECPYKPFGCTVTLREDQKDKHIEQQVHKHLGLLQCAYSRLKIYQNTATASSSSRTNLPEYLRQDSRDSTRWLLQDESQDDYQFRRQRSWDSVRFARKHLRPSSHLVTSGSSAWMPVSEESLYHQQPQHTPSLPLQHPPQYSSTPRAYQNHHTQQHHHHHPSHLPHPQKERESCGAAEGASCSPEKGKLNGGGGGGGDGGDPHLADIFKRLVLLEQQNYEKQIKIEKLQAELNSVLGLSRTSAQIIEDFQARHCNGLYVWKVSNFRRRCLDMRRNPNRWLYSPGFYTDTFGYKIFLRFNLTAPALTTSAGASASVSSSSTQPPGQDPGQVPLEQDHDTFVSLYVHFMPGEFDDTLPWPFKGSMTLMIVHPSKPEESVVEYMQSKPETTAFDKPPPPHNTKGFGYAEFWPLHKIFSDGFVKDDTLTFEIIAKSVDRQQHALK